MSDEEVAFPHPESANSKTVGRTGSKARHVVLTRRDLELMTALHDDVVLSFHQIFERYFLGRTMPTAMNRLKRLESDRLITRTRVPRLYIVGRKNHSGVVFQLSLRGRGALAIHRPDIEVQERCPVLNLNQVDHDLLIGDIAPNLKRQYPDHEWINGRYVMAEDGFNKIPDAILKSKNDQKVVAIELELNAKSMRRYREIVASLKASARIGQVIFVTANTAIGRKIMSAIEGYQVPIGHRLRSEFFEFLRLTDCLPKNR